MKTCAPYQIWTRQDCLPLAVHLAAATLQVYPKLLDIDEISAEDCCEAVASYIKRFNADKDAEHLVDGTRTATWEALQDASRVDPTIAMFPATAGQHGERSAFVLHPQGDEDRWSSPHGYKTKVQWYRPVPGGARQVATAQNA